jgi:hypothetical protein
MLKLISKFPFLKVEKSGYERIVMNDHENTEKQMKLIKSVKETLSLNQIPTHKIRFIFVPSFLYDIDNDKINPVFVIMMPKKLGNKKKKPIIEINKPQNSIKISIMEYVNIDDHEIIKPLVKSSKRGVVMYLDEIDFQGVVGAVNLDISIAQHNQTLENFKYNT